MSLFRALCETPARLSTSSRFTALNGVFYMGVGAVLLIWPGAVQTLFRDPVFVGRESALVRVLGMTVAILGWFYFFGGRSGGRQVVAASVVDRIALVPLVLVPLAVTGVFPHLLLTLAIVDPVLGLVAWQLLRREQTAGMGDHPAA